LRIHPHQLIELDVGWHAAGIAVLENNLQFTPPPT
jgi:hypothetical protein